MPHETKHAQNQAQFRIPNSALRIYLTSTVQPNSSGSLPNCIPVILS